MIGRCWFVLFVPLALLLAGCATSNSGRKVDELEIRLVTLESRMNSVEQKQGITELEPIEDAGSAVGQEVIKKVNLSKKDIQRALKNANFYNGPIDGRIGRNTKRAIREFQKANGLKADGIVGKETKRRLTEYL